MHKSDDATTLNKDCGKHRSLKVDIVSYVIIGESCGRRNVLQKCNLLQQRTTHCKSIYWNMLIYLWCTQYHVVISFTYVHIVTQLSAITMIYICLGIYCRVPLEFVPCHTLNFTHHNRLSLITNLKRRLVLHMVSELLCFLEKLTVWCISYTGMITDSYFSISYLHVISFKTTPHLEVDFSCTFCHGYGIHRDFI